MILLLLVVVLLLSTQSLTPITDNANSCPSGGVYSTGNCYCSPDYPCFSTGCNSVLYFQGYGRLTTYFSWASTNNLVCSMMMMMMMITFHHCLTLPLIV